MAALCTGISYGLSQSCLSNQNKELIFVKLTDSAYRAIEEYQKNQVSISLCCLCYSLSLAKWAAPYGLALIHADHRFEFRDTIRFDSNPRNLTKSDFQFFMQRLTIVWIGSHYNYTNQVKRRISVSIRKMCMFHYSQMDWPFILC